MKILTFAAALAAASMAHAGDTPSPDGAAVYFVNLADGDTVKSPVTVVFGLSGMGVAPAGTDRENTGHHHLLLNRPALGEGTDGAEEFDFAMPANDTLIHFGGGQTQTTLDLAPGRHSLQLVLGDLNHIPHEPPVMSEVIHITVE